MKKLLLLLLCPVIAHGQIIVNKQLLATRNRGVVQLETSQNANGSYNLTTVGTGTDYIITNPNFATDRNRAAVKLSGTYNNDGTFSISTTGGGGAGTITGGSGGTTGLTLTGAPILTLGGTLGTSNGGGGGTTPLASLQNLTAKGADIASAATTDLSTATGSRLNVTGTATITSLGTVTAGSVFTLEFTGASQITYNGTSMILLSGASVTNANGTVRVFESLGSGNWKELFNNTSGAGTPGGSNTQIQYNNSTAFGGTSGETTNGTVNTLTAPILAGVVTSSGANILSSNAMGALSIDVTKENNTKSIAVDSTFTFSATPGTDTWFSCIIKNTDTVSHVATIPSSISLAQSATITTVTVPANSAVVHLTWHYDGTSYYLYGDSPAGLAFNYPLSSYAAGTVYSLTATPAAIVFGTTSPVLTLDKAGTYLIFGRAYLAYNGATYAATQTATVKLRRTNNTAADIANGTTTATLRVITTITDTVGVMPLPPVTYTTTNTNDSVTLFGSVSATPAAGSVDVKEASLMAVKLY